jgi:general secretion pathway protein K
MALPRRFRVQSTPEAQRGLALVLVLWILILLTVTTGAFALMARMDQLEANQLLSGTRARFYAEAGLNLAVVKLREPEEELRMIADGRPYATVIDEVLIEVSATDERGKLDINAADETTLAVLFTNHGLEPADAEVLAARVMDWRDPDDVERVDGAELDTYLAEGLALGPGNRNFMMVDELLQVLGMPYELWRRMEPGLTVHSRNDLPDIAFAPAEALLAIPDITPDEASAFVAERQALEASDGLEIALPNGETIVAQGRGLTYSVRVKATMPNGVWDQIEATVRLGGNAGGPPFRVLRWREGFNN